MSLLDELFDDGAKTAPTAVEAAGRLAQALNRDLEADARNKGAKLLGQYMPAVKVWEINNAFFADIGGKRHPL